MPADTTAGLNFLYRMDTDAGVFTYSGIGSKEALVDATAQTYDSEKYYPHLISHTQPTFSSDPTEADIDITVSEDNPVARMYLSHPPPYTCKVRIYEYDRNAASAEAHWAGTLLRVNFDLRGKVTLRCRVGHLFERETLSDSLAALSRYSIYDPRSGVDYEALKIVVTVTALNDWKDVITVTGVTNPPTWFKGGMMKAPDGDLRTIILQSGNDAAPPCQLTLNGAFPSTTLVVGSVVEIYPGDDLLHSTWDTKFSAGAKHGGWAWMPNSPQTK